MPYRSVCVCDQILNGHRCPRFGGKLACQVKQQMLDAHTVDNGNLRGPPLAAPPSQEIAGLMKGSPAVEISAGIYSKNPVEIVPIGFMYGIFTYIYPKNQPFM